MTHRHFVRTCPTCKRVRWVYRLVGTSDLNRWGCSQGHLWATAKPTMEKMVEAMKIAIRPVLVQSLFEESVLYRRLAR